MIIWRKYGTGTTILFPLVDAGTSSFENTPVTHASGDIQISKDEGNFANTSNAFAHEGNGIYSLVLTVAEMQAARISITIIDQGTKAWEDQCVLLETYGNTSAQHTSINVPIAGALEITYTVKENDEDTGDPIDGVEVWITTDSGGSNVIWSGTTDTNGVVRESGDSKPYLDAGTYYFWRKKAGYVFINPDEETFS